MRKLLPALATLILLLSGCDVDLGPSNVKVSEQPADGLTASSFDQGYLLELVEEVRQGAETSLQQAYERNKIPPQERISHAEAVGRYEWIGDRQLAVIELSYSANPMRVTRIVGIEQDRLISISCISPRGDQQDLHAATGECAETLRRRFPSSAAR